MVAKPVLVVLVLTSTLAGGCKLRRGAEAEHYLINEAWGAAKAPVVFSNLKSMPIRNLSRPEFRRGEASVKPWYGESFVPATGGMVRRWLDPDDTFDFSKVVDAPPEVVEREIESYLNRAKLAAKEHQVVADLSPLEKYDLVFFRDVGVEEGFALTRREIVNLAHQVRSSNFAVNDWYRPQYHFGWAVASQLSPAPEHAVAIDIGSDFSVVFTPSDIKSLLSKAFEENTKTRPARVHGLPCSIEQARTNAGMQDGWLGEWNDTTRRLENSYPIEVLHARWSMHEGTEANFVIFADSIDFQTKSLSFERWLDQKAGVAQVQVRPMQLTKDSSIDLTTEGQRMAFRYERSCLDVNPAALHLTLAKLLSDAALREAGETGRLVIELQQGGFPVNYPVVGYETQLGQPTPLIGTSALVPPDVDGYERNAEEESMIAATPVMIDDAEARETLELLKERERYQEARYGYEIAKAHASDPLRGFRNQSVNALVHVITKLKVAQESTPADFSDQESAMLGELRYEYLLELDQTGFVVGGQWYTAPQGNDQPLSGDELLLALNAMVAQDTWVNSETPLRIWSYPIDTSLESRCTNQPCLAADSLARLIACSRQKNQNLVTVDIMGEAYPAMACKL